MHYTTVTNGVYTKTAYEFEVTGWQELVLESSDKSSACIISYGTI